MEMLADEMEKRGGATHLANVNTDIDDDMAIGFFCFRATHHTYFGHDN